MNHFYFFQVTQGISHILSDRYSLHHSFQKDVESSSRHSEEHKIVTRAFSRAYNGLPDSKSSTYKKLLLKDYFLKKKYKTCTLVDRVREKFFPVDSEFLEEELTEDIFVDFMESFFIEITEVTELTDDKPNAKLVNPKLTSYVNKKVLQNAR